MVVFFKDHARTFFLTESLVVSPVVLPLVISSFLTLGVVEDISHEAELMPDFGLFEASHIACPVLPQYHPKQLMELLNSGKIRWVKAILAHLVRCLGGTDQMRQRSGGSFNNEDGTRSPRMWSRSRTLSVSYGQGQMTNSASGGLSPGKSCGKCFFRKHRNNFDS